MEEIKEFFGKAWNQTEVDPHVCDRLQHAVNPIDVGCGFNPYKQFNKNLIGLERVSAFPFLAVVKFSFC